jgi:acetyl-CoA carboxylase carboxyl transferase subunit alpha
LTAEDLLSQGIVDRIIPEPLGGAHKDHLAIASTLKAVIKEELSALLKIKPEKLVQNRMEKFGKMGLYEE